MWGGRSGGSERVHVRRHREWRPPERGQQLVLCRAPKIGEEIEDSFLRSNSHLELCAWRKAGLEKQPLAHQIYLKSQMCVDPGEFRQAPQDPRWKGTSVCPLGARACEAAWLGSPRGGGVLPCAPW